MEWRASRHRPPERRDGNEFAVSVSCSLLHRGEDSNYLMFSDRLFHSFALKIIEGNRLSFFFSSARLLNRVSLSIDEIYRYFCRPLYNCIHPLP